MKSLRIAFWPRLSRRIDRLPADAKDLDRGVGRRRVNGALSEAECKLSPADYQAWGRQSFSRFTATLQQVAAVPEEKFEAETAAMSSGAAAQAGSGATIRDSSIFPCHSF
jgi:hypothetical protein